MTTIYLILLDNNKLFAYCILVLKGYTILFQKVYKVCCFYCLVLFWKIKASGCIFLPSNNKSGFQIIPFCDYGLLLLTRANLLYQWKFNFELEHFWKKIQCFFSKIKILGINVRTVLTIKFSKTTLKYVLSWRPNNVCNRLFIPPYSIVLQPKRIPSGGKHP